MVTETVAAAIWDDVSLRIPTVQLVLLAMLKLTIVVRSLPVSIF